MATPHELRLVQGVDFSEVFTWSSQNGRESFAGWTPAAQMRRYLDGPVVLDLGENLTVEDGIPDSHGVEGEALRLYLSGEETAALAWGGVWDLLLVNGPTRIKLFTGKATVERTVTRVDG